MSELEFAQTVSIDFLMSRLHLGKQYPDGVIPDTLYSKWYTEFELTPEKELWIGNLHNYLNINHPMRSEHLNLLTTYWGARTPDHATVEEQWFNLSVDEQAIHDHSLIIANTMIQITGYVQALRAAYITYFLDYYKEVVPDKKSPTISCNGNNASLRYMKYLHGELKDYWAVALFPIQEQRLVESYYLESDQWDMKIGRIFSEEYLIGPFGKIVFEESKVVPITGVKH